MLSIDPSPLKVAISLSHASTGIRPAFAAKLKEMGVDNVLQLANLSSNIVASQFPVSIRRTQAELNSNNAVVIGDMGDPRQMINVGRTFGRPIESMQDIAPAFAAFAMKTPEKLHKQRSVSGGIRTYLMPATRSRGAPQPLTASFTIRTSDPRSIANAAVRCSEQMFRNGVAYSKGGICLLDLDQLDSASQGSLFATYDEEGERVSSLISQVNARFGRGSISVGRSLGSKKWMPKADMLSCAYTTKIQQLKVVY